MCCLVIADTLGSGTEWTSINDGTEYDSSATISEYAGAG